MHVHAEIFTRPATLYTPTTTTTSARRHNNIHMQGEEMYVTNKATTSCRAADFTQVKVSVSNDASVHTAFINPHETNMSTGHAYPGHTKIPANGFACL